MCHKSSWDREKRRWRRSGLPQHTLQFDRPNPYPVAPPLISSTMVLLFIIYHSFIFKFINKGTSKQKILFFMIYLFSIMQMRKAKRNSIIQNLSSCFSYYTLVFISSTALILATGSYSCCKLLIEVLIWKSVGFISTNEIITLQVQRKAKLQLEPPCGRVKSKNKLILLTLLKSSNIIERKLWFRMVSHRSLSCWIKVKTDMTSSATPE
jgi:hypothetical protein